MILKRLGNKTKIAEKIIPYLPPNVDLWIEPFFGAGGMFFNLGNYRPKYCYLNDNDKDVFNLFVILQDEQKRAELVDFLQLVPYDANLLKFWKEHKETDCIKAAGRFLFLSNFTIYGKMDTLRQKKQNAKKDLIYRIKEFYDGLLNNCTFDNKDALKFIKAFSFCPKKDIYRSVIYIDWPYFHTTDNYENPNKWTIQKAKELLKYVLEKGYKVCISEFDGVGAEAILSAFPELQKHIIGERRNLQNRRTEIILTNYTPELYIQKQLFA